MLTAEEIYHTHPTDDEIAEVLAQRNTAALGTLNEDGSIHLTYVIYLFEGGLFHIETSSVTRKARNVAERGSASLLVDGRAASTGRRLMVSAEGQARLVGPPEAAAISDRVRDKYLVPEVAAQVNAAWRRFDDVAIELRPSRWRSWTNELLKAAIEAEIDRPYGEVWRE
jgi:hypothetical protein